MSDISQFDSDSASPRNTQATTYGETNSIASSHVYPAAPHPTPAHTIAGDVPNNEWIARQLQGLEVSSETKDRSDPASGSGSGSDHVESNQSDLSVEYPEASKWDGVAEEDVTQALQRLAVLADDEHKEDPTKTVEHYYSVRLAKLIAAGNVKFDASYLK